MELIFATRPSALARRQTQLVIQALQQAHPGLVCREQVITTQGDRVLDRPLPEIGGKGLFTGELEAALLNGRVHAAVHSLKDLPVEERKGLVIAAVPARAEARDVLVSADGSGLEALAPGGRVGTSSLRRAAQLLAYRPDLKVASLRGNVDTRLRKVKAGDYDAILLSGAGLLRLDLEESVTEWLPLEVMLPAPGQGALAVQCRAGDEQTRAVLAALDDPATRQATGAERAFLAGLGGGCSLPVAAFGEAGGRSIHLRGLVASLDGQNVIRCDATGLDPHETGMACARQALALGASRYLAHAPAFIPPGERHA